MVRRNGSKRGLSQKLAMTLGGVEPADPPADAIRFNAFWPLTAPTDPPWDFQSAKLLPNFFGVAAFRRFT